MEKFHVNMVIIIVRRSLTSDLDCIRLHAVFGSHVRYVTNNCFVDFFHVPPELLEDDGVLLILDVEEPLDFAFFNSCHVPPFRLQSGILLQFPRLSAPSILVVWMGMGVNSSIVVESYKPWTVRPYRHSVPILMGK
jgi:hypothetical protein